MIPQGPSHLFTSAACVPKESTRHSGNLEQQDLDYLVVRRVKELWCRSRGRRDSRWEMELGVRFLSWDIPIKKWCPDFFFFFFCCEFYIFSHKKKQFLSVSHVSRSFLFHWQCLTNAILGKVPMQIYLPR